MQNQFSITDINYKSDQINTDLFCFAEYKKSVFVHPIRVIRVPLYLCPNGSSPGRGGSEIFITKTLTGFNVFSGKKIN